MREIYLIAKKELQATLRQPYFRVLAFITILLFLLAGWVGYRHFINEHTERQRAQHEKRQQWLNQGEKHPHIAAHYGSFAFKPSLKAKEP